MTLIADKIYSFKVIARNSVGSSFQSESLPIRAAKAPNAPINLSSDPAITTAYQIGLKWSESNDNGGTAALNYLVEYKKETDSAF